MIVLAIDPGLTGAAGVIDSNGVRALFDLPTMPIPGVGEKALVQRKVDSQALRRLILDACPAAEPVAAVVEAVGVMGGKNNSVQSQGSLMRTLGAVEAVLECLRLEVEYPRIWAPDYTKGGQMTAQPGRRAVWHLKNRKPLPEGWRVWSTCSCPGCIAPDCGDAGPTSKWGEHMARIGKHKTMVHRAASRRSGKARMVLSPDQITMVQSDPRTGRELAKTLGVSEQTISRARNGRIVCHLPLGSPFAGLGAR